MDIKDAINQLEKMKGRPFVYKNKVVEILSYADYVGDEGDEIEIYLNDGTVIECLMVHLDRKLKDFTSATGTIVTLAHHKLDQVSCMKASVTQELRDTVMESIRALKTNPESVEQAKQIFQGVNTMINLAKTELEFRKYLDQSVAQRNKR